RAREIGADGELAHAIAVWIAVGVIPELFPKFFILRMGLYQTIPGNNQSEGRFPQITELGAEIITDHAIHNECPVHFERTGECFASREIPPLVTADDAARFDPLVIRG